MRCAASVLLFALAALPAAAQTLPQPGADNPRIQTARWTPQSEVQLTALPGTGLTVMLEPGEQIRRATIDDPRAFDIRVSAERDSFLVLPTGFDPASALTVETDRRTYQFSLTTGDGLMAAYLVQFEFGSPPTSTGQFEVAMPFELEATRSYRLRGDRAVRPASIEDDGIRTHITFAPRQPLPAVFAIGPGGDEQVVNGYMRGDIYVIDRIHDELVFRIDKEKATARRVDAEGTRR